jgi:small nuclear ribonucleoprotein (snRNP)-like protein
METVLKITLNDSEVLKQAQELADKTRTAQVKEQLGSFFAVPRYGIKEGLGRAQIREKVESIIEKLFDENTLIAKLEQRVEHHFNIMLEQAIEDAAKHRARKLTFFALNNHLKDKAAP